MAECRECNTRLRSKAVARHTLGNAALTFSCYCMLRTRQLIILQHNAHPKCVLTKQKPLSMQLATRQISRSLWRGPATGRRAAETLRGYMRPPPVSGRKVDRHCWRVVALYEPDRCMHMHCCEMAKRQPATTAINRPVNDGLEVRWVTTSEPHWRTPAVVCFVYLFQVTSFFSFSVPPICIQNDLIANQQGLPSYTHLGCGANNNMFRYLD
jgi:hypothetical protein